MKKKKLSISIKYNKIFKHNKKIKLLDDYFVKWIHEYLKTMATSFNTINYWSIKFITTNSIYLFWFIPINNGKSWGFRFELVRNKREI